MIYNTDLSQAENRIVAYIANDKRMISAFTDPSILKHGGVHSLTASFIYNIPIEEVSDEKGSSGFNPNLSQRDIGKRCNHALNYRMGVNTFAERADISIPNARHIRSRYLKSVYPMVERGYWIWIEESIRKNRSVTNLFGRTYRFMDRWGEELLKQACAFTPQSSVAHIINVFGIKEIWQNPKKYEGLVLLQQVHDSLVFSIADSYPIPHHSALIRRLVSSLEPVLRFEDREWVIPAEVQAGYNLGKRKKKGRKIENPEGLRDVDLKKDVEEQLKEIRR